MIKLYSNTGRFLCTASTEKEAQNLSSLVTLIEGESYIDMLHTMVY